MSATKNQKRKLCDMLYRNICFIAVVLNQTCNISEVCLSIQTSICIRQSNLESQVSSLIRITSLKSWHFKHFSRLSFIPVLMATQLCISFWEVKRMMNIEVSIWSLWAITHTQTQKRKACPLLIKLKNMYIQQFCKKYTNSLKHRRWNKYAINHHSEKGFNSSWMFY